MRKIIFGLCVLVGFFGNAQQLLEVLRPSSTSHSGLPSEVSIENGKYIIASTYDTNYLPFSTPTEPATWDRNIHPDTNAEIKTLDYQGKIPQEGIIVQIPIKVSSVGSNPKIPAYTQTINIPAWKTEDGNSRNLTLSWEEQPYNADTKFIRATLKPDGLLNIKKLDLNAGLGNDYKGVEVATFNYAYQYTDNSTTGTSIFEVRALSGIPDRHFGEVDNKHNFLYLPIFIEGPNNYKKLWLNYNLGAEYGNVNNPNGNFNPTVIEVDKYDVRSYGSRFQWQRPADGHELTFIEYPDNINHIQQERLVGESKSWQPRHDKRYTGSHPDLRSWVSKDLDNGSGIGLWKANGANNPCPEGFYVASKEDYELLYYLTEYMGNREAIKLVASFSKAFNGLTSEFHLWTSDDGSWENAYAQQIFRLNDDTSGAHVGGSLYDGKSKTYPVRCVSNN